MDNDNLPWTYVHSVDTNGVPQFYPGIGWYSSFTWGGMRAPKPEYDDADYYLVPPEIRALNKLIEPNARNKDVIKVVQCPGDRSSFIPVVGENQEDLEIESVQTAWEEVGSSYGINWNFMEEPALGIPFNLTNLMRYGKEVVNKNSGGAAAEFALMWEVQADQLFVGAFDNDGNGGRLGMGWHRKFSYHSFLFLDSHVEHRHFDTRHPRGPGWRLTIH